jgi:hypothetical protein
MLEAVMLRLVHPLGSRGYLSSALLEDVGQFVGNQRISD